MIKHLMSGLLALFIATSAFAQNPIPPVPPPVPVGTTAVAGLELPPDQTVPFDEGFVNLQAKCKGEVKWLVISANKIKYIVVPQTNSIIISIPPSKGVINVFAVGLVDGKLTEFVRTNIEVENGGGTVNPPINPPGPPINGKLHLTFLVDMNNASPEVAKLLNSESLRKTINQKGHWFRLYDINSPLVAQKKLTPIVQKVGGDNVLIIQSDDGKVLSATPIPKTEQDVIGIIQQLTGK